MAATSRATTPRAESFRSIDLAPRTPTSLPSLQHSGYVSSKESVRSAPSYRASLSPNTSKQGFSPRSSPHALTGAVAIADARRHRQQKNQEEARQTSPNPNAVALNALMGSTGMSRSSDAPPTSQVSEPMQKVAERIALSTADVPSPRQPRDGDPTTTTETGTSGSRETLTVTVSNHEGEANQFVEEPENMDDNGIGSVPPEDDHGNRPFTYPGPLSSSQRLQEESTRRDMSLPGSAYDRSPKSSSSKRHKCPYCSTDFTRHHNLKSHLLTHSQEKPYVCQTCQARFRRLHDLKRHTKLHTGERPHICPKCGRRFARGDALARHNKGPGGCAGRRSSIGEDDGGEDDTMDGLEYQDEPGSDERDSEMLDAQGRRGSEPMNRKRPHPDSSPYDGSRSIYRQHSSTYPPPQGRIVRQEAGTMGPPQTVLPPPPNQITSPEQHSHTGPSAASSYSSQLYSTHAPVAYPMTESPQPISPANAAQQRMSVSDVTGLRGRSPSLTQQFQQHHYGRGTEQGHHAQTIVASHPPHLPVLPGLGPGPQQSRLSTVQQAPPVTSVLQHPPPAHHAPHVPAPNSTGGSLSSHGHSSGASSREIMGTDPQEMWNYVRSLEQRFSRMQDEYELRISRLQEDVIALKGQVYRGR